MKQLVQILDDIQKGESEHLKHLLSFQKIYNKNKKQFKAELIPVIQRVLVISQNDPSVDRLISFISKFASKQGENDEFIDFLVSYLVDTTRVVNKTIRLRSCQIIASVLGSLPAEAEISDDVFENLSKRMVPRLRDKIPQVRIEAVKALARLQDPSDIEDPVVSGFIKLLRADSNKDVRKAVLKNIAASAITLPHILNRARDNAADIRVIVFKLMSEIEIHQLDISQRILLLRNGLGDREDNVKNACVTMICSWIKSKSNDNDPVNLLNYLLVEKFEDVAEKVVKLILRNCDISWTPPKVKKSTLPKLSAESALVWRIYLSWLKKRVPKEPEVQELLDKSAPTIPEFCLLLKAHITNEAIAKQLVGMIKHLDLGDEVQRRDLASELSKFLPSSRISESLKKSIMVTLKMLQASDEDAYIAMILEIISEIQDPLEASQAVQDEIETGSSQTSKRSLFVRGPSTFNLRSSSSNLRSLTHPSLATIPESPPSLRRAATTNGAVSPGSSEAVPENWLSTSTSSKLAELKKLRTKFANKQDQHAVHRIDMEIAILEADIDNDKLSAEERRWLHCMALTEQLLQLTSKDLENPGIHDLLSNVILVYVAHPMPRIRERAMRCLGLFCMLSKDVARMYLHLFSQALQNDQLQIQCVVLKLLFDLLLVYGMDGFEEIESSSQKPDGHEERKRIGDRSEIMNMVSGFLLHESAELRAIVVEGFSKLMYGGQISDPKILAKLIVLFFLDPEHEAESKSGDQEGNITTPYAHIRQCLSVFLPAYSFQSTEHMKIVLSAFIPTIREVTHNIREYLHESEDEVQPTTITKVARLFFHLTISDIKEGVNCPHNELAIKLTKEIIADPNDPDNLKLCRVLKDLRLSQHPPSIKTLKFFISALIEKVRDSSYSKILAKFLEDLQTLDPVPEIEPTEAVLENLKQELILHGIERKEYIESKQESFPKRRVKRFSSYESDLSSSESEDDDTKTEAPVAEKRNVPGRRSKQIASDKMEEISMNMKSLKETILQMNQVDNSKKSSSSKRGRRTKKGETSGEEGSENEGDHGEEEGEMEIEDSDEDGEHSKKRPTRKAAQKANKVDVQDSSEEESDSEQDDEDYEEVQSPKKSPTKSPTKSPPASRKKVTHSDEEYSSSSSPKKRQNDKSEDEVTSPSKRAKKKVTEEIKKRKRTSKGQIDSDDGSGASSSDNSPKKKRGRKSRSDSDQEKVEESGSDEETPRTRGQKKAAANKEKKKVISDDEESDAEVPEVRRSPRKSKPVYSSDKDNSTRNKNAKKEEDGKAKDEEKDEEDEEKLQRTKSSPKKKEKQKAVESDGESEDEQKRRKETARNTFINSSLPELSQVRSVVVAFSEDVAKDEVQKLTTMIERINGKVHTGTVYSADITHVIEGKQPTTKTLLAIVSSRWLVSQKWIKDSALYGAFLNEKQYGVKCNNPIFKKRFHLDPSLKEGDKRRLDLITSLIKVGRGTVVSSATEADIVLVGNDFKGKGKKGKKGEEDMVFQWDDLVNFLRVNRYPA